MKYNERDEINNLIKTVKKLMCLLGTDLAFLCFLNHQNQTDSPQREITVGRSIAHTIWLQVLSHRDFSQTTQDLTQLDQIQLPEQMKLSS